MAGRWSADDTAAIRKRLYNGSLTVAGDPPVDACVKKLIHLQQALLAPEGDNKETACADFCEALDSLSFHLNRTRHAGRIAQFETKAYLELQSEIARLQEAARK